MRRSDYYGEMRALARQVREEHGLAGARIIRSDLRRIYAKEGIKLDLWPHRLKNLRGAYFNDELGATVMLDKTLPDEPAIFTLCHELKHHLADREKLLSFCDSSNVDDMVEIGAEVFAAEMIFPEADYVATMEELMSGRPCTPELLVHLKRNTRTTLSYAGLAKRAEFLRLVAPGSLARVQWKKLEERMFGEPDYKRIQRYRKARSSAE